ncbi:hypothetical protein [[Phormidium ambiguum] IAM M-71]|uniref:hypothetical protein n=1 Tax=[Phormidium ambiguum] IAM M-71 TaxID=454136 RepID=UPI0009373E6F|nr:hypothetical protein [Phormidium ambiguum]
MLPSDSYRFYSRLPHHVASGEIHWYYSDYHQEKFNGDRFSANLEGPIDLELGGYCGLKKANTHHAIF